MSSEPEPTVVPLPSPRKKQRRARRLHAAINQPRLSDWRPAVEDRLGFLEAERKRQGNTDSALATSITAVKEALTHSVHPDRTWRERVSAWWSGWDIEQAWRALHDAEARLLSRDPDLADRLPGLRERVAKHLAKDDLRRKALDRLDLDKRSPVAAQVVVEDALRASFAVSDDAHNSLRVLRNKLVLAGFLLLVLNIVIGWLSSVHPGLMPLCTGPNEETCPSRMGTISGGDIWLVQLLGMFGATVATVVLLVRRRPSLTSYLVLGYQALIKILLGAALAILGVLALSAGLLDAIVKVEERSVLLLWAVLFGYAQQVGTRLLDDYADRVVDKARPLPNGEAKN